jgi:hypothetical protein
MDNKQPVVDWLQNCVQRGKLQSSEQMQQVASKLNDAMGMYQDIKQTICQSQNKLQENLSRVNVQKVDLTWCILDVELFLQ